MSDDNRKKRAGSGEEEVQERHSGSKEAKDLEFAKWINRQWARGEKLQKIDVVQFFNKGGKRGFGEVVGFDVFSPGRVMNLEEAVDLSNRLIGQAQLDVDRVMKKPMTYYARAHDVGRAASDEAVDTFPLEISPSRRYISLAGTEEEEVTAQQLALAYMKEGMAAFQRDRDREDTNIGEIIAMLVTDRREDREYMRQLVADNRRTMAEWVAAIRDREAAFASEEDRALRREITKLKIDGLKEGARFGKNLLTGLIGGASSAPPVGQAPGPAVPNSNGVPQQVETRMTKERMLLDEFLNDCKNAKLDIPLFGEWSRGPDGPVCHKPGIFTPEQTRIFLGVHGGFLLAEALDDLMFGSGSPVAITMDQLAAAQALPGMNDSISINLVSLDQHRKQMRAQNAKPATATATATSAPTTTERGFEDV